LYQFYLNQFTQPDTIVPNIKNPQSLNRYTYALNNPIRYSDPSGHNYCDRIRTGEDEDCQYIRETRKFNEVIKYVHDKIVNDDWQVKKQYVSAFEVMNLITGKAAEIYGNDWNGFLKATNYVFLGTYSNSSATMYNARRYTGDFRGITFSNGTGDIGFHDDFKDNDNQVRHFWAAFATAAYRQQNNIYDDDNMGGLVAVLGAFEHDVIEDWAGIPDSTVADLALSIAGINIGKDVYAGRINSPSDLPGVFDSTLGIYSPGYTGSDLRWIFFRTPDE
jgi:hypothetical protein